MKTTFIKLPALLLLFLESTAWAMQDGPAFADPALATVAWGNAGKAYRDERLQKTLHYFEAVRAWAVQQPEDWQAAVAQLYPAGMRALQEDITALKASLAATPESASPLSYLAENNPGDPLLKIKLSYPAINQRIQDLFAEDRGVEICFSSFEPPYTSYFMYYGLAQLEPSSEDYKLALKLIKKYEREIERKIKKNLGPTCCTFDRPPQFVASDEKLSLIIPGKTSCTNLGFLIVKYNISLPSLVIDFLPENPSAGPSYFNFVVRSGNGMSLKASIMQSILNGKEVRTALDCLFPFFDFTNIEGHKEYMALDFTKKEEIRLENVLEFFALRRTLNEWFGVTAPLSSNWHKNSNYP